MYAANNNSKGVRLPADCADMAELRAEIDRLDAELITLFATRAAYIKRAAELKKSSGDPAFIPERVELVVENARKRAASLDLNGVLFETIWRQLVADAIQQEEEFLKR